LKCQEILFIRLALDSCVLLANRYFLFIKATKESEILVKKYLFFKKITSIMSGPMNLCRITQYLEQIESNKSNQLQILI